MFDELRIKRNEDNTYSMLIKGYQDNSGQRHKVEINRLKNLRLEVDAKKEPEGLFDNKLPFAVKQAMDWKLNITAPLLPDENGQVMRMRKQRKRKTINH